VLAGLGVSDSPPEVGAPHSSNPAGDNSNSPAERNRRAGVRNNRVARRLPGSAPSRPRRHRRLPRLRRRTARQAGPARSAIPIHCTSTAPMPQTLAERSRSQLKDQQPQYVHNSQLDLRNAALSAYTQRNGKTCPPRGESPDGQYQRRAPLRCRGPRSSESSSATAGLRVWRDLGSLSRRQYPHSCPRWHRIRPPCHRREKRLDITSFLVISWESYGYGQSGPGKGSSERIVG
jgi:hypothetical protein